MRDKGVRSETIQAVERQRARHRLPDLNYADLPRLRLPNRISNLSKLRPVCRNVIELGDENNDPQPLLPGGILKLKVLVQSHEDIEVRSSFLHQLAVG